MNTLLQTKISLNLHFDILYSKTIELSSIPLHPVFDTVSPVCYPFTLPGHRRGRTRPVQWGSKKEPRSTYEDF